MVRRKAKHKSLPTSILAYVDILEELGERQTLVYTAIRNLKSCNNVMIAEFLGLPINSVTPRVNELRKTHIVMMDKKELCPYTKRLTCYW